MDSLSVASDRALGSSGRGEAGWMIDGAHLNCSTTLMMAIQHGEYGLSRFDSISIKGARMKKKDLSKKRHDENTRASGRMC